MKQRNKIVCVIMLLTIGLAAISPVMGSAIKATHQTIGPLQTNSPQYVVIDFVDCTNVVPVHKEVTMSKTEWMTMRNELRGAAAPGASREETLCNQFVVLQKHRLVSADVPIDSVLQKINRNVNSEKIQPFLRRAHTAPLINNSIFSAMSAISFEIQNGTNAVFGLNTFINIIGFDIVSFHKGYAVNGVQTNGLISKSIPPGEYFGFMFGFFGYWFGTKVSTGVYSDVTVAGLAIVTVWLPSPTTP